MSVRLVQLPGVPVQSSNNQITSPRRLCARLGRIWPRPLWPRKRIEIPCWSLLKALRQLFFGASPATCHQAIQDFWQVPVLIGLSERSCFDLYLQHLRLPAGSEVLVSAINIDGMSRILREHKITPIAVDLDPKTLQPDLDQARERCTPRCAAFLFAHLFGARSDLSELAAFCEANELLLWEDCAQAFDGMYRGADKAHASFFSFGPIKAFSALGGGVAIVKDTDLHRRIAEGLAKYPPQSRWRYAQRLWKYLGVQLISHPRIFRFVSLLFKSRQQRDAVLASSFRNTPDQGFFLSIRKRPCLPLLRVLADRISNLRNSESERTLRAAGLASALRARMGPTFQILGEQAPHHSYWVFPVLAPQSETLLDCLDAAGFDATDRCQLKVLETHDAATPRARSMLEQVIFLPCYASMSSAEIERLAVTLENAMDVAVVREKRKMEGSLDEISSFALPKPR